MKVLVVDDSQLNLAIAQQYLKSITAISQIFVTTQPQKVKDIVDEQKIDILILDIIMPEVSGIDLLTLFRSDKNYDDMPIIMLTSLDDMDSYQRCYDLGAFDYINKPIKPIELNARLKVAIESKNNSNNLKAMVEVTKQQNEDLKIINAKLTETQFSLVQSEKMAAIGQLSAGIAHEINNPMGFVSSNFDVLQKYFKRIKEYLSFVTERMQKAMLSDYPITLEAVKEITDKYHSLKLDIIMEELDGLFSDSSTGIQRITEIIQSLRVFSRASNDGDREMRVLHEIMAQVLLITRNEVKYVATAEMDVPEDISLFCNRVQLGQVFVNIIVNAAQAIKTQKRSTLGSIMVRARKTEQKVVIEISDDGPGIPEENRSKIFEPFYTTKDVGQGTGLGLSISYDIIVNKHKGTIDVQSELGKGTTFVITLPIIIAE